MSTERRPDPDELLARVKEAETRQTRGKLALQGMEVEVRGVQQRPGLIGQRFRKARMRVSQRGNARPWFIRASSVTSVGVSRVRSYGTDTEKRPGEATVCSPTTAPLATILIRSAAFDSRSLRSRSMTIRSAGIPNGNKKRAFLPRVESS